MSDLSPDEHAAVAAELLEAASDELLPELEAQTLAQIATGHALLASRPVLLEKSAPDNELVRRAVADETAELRSENEQLTEKLADAKREAHRMADQTARLRADLTEVREWAMRTARDKVEEMVWPEISGRPVPSTGEHPALEGCERPEHADGHHGPECVPKAMTDPVPSTGELLNELAVSRARVTELGEALHRLVMELHEYLPGDLPDSLWEALNHAEEVAVAASVPSTGEDQSPEWKRCGGTVVAAGGGQVTVNVDRDTEQYPPKGGGVMLERRYAEEDQSERDRHDNREPVAKALGLLGAAYRGDWTDFDGRTLRAQLDELAGTLTASKPFDVKWWAAGQGICPDQQAWAEHCDNAIGFSSCTHIEAIFTTATSDEPVPDGEDQGDDWRCSRCGSARWVSASLTGPVSLGGNAIRQCVTCGHHSTDPTPQQMRRDAAARPVPDEGSETDE